MSVKLLPFDKRPAWSLRTLSRKCRDWLPAPPQGIGPGAVPLCPLVEVSKVALVSTLLFVSWLVAAAFIGEAPVPQVTVTHDTVRDNGSTHGLTATFHAVWD